MTGPDVHALLDRLLPAEQRRLWVAGEWRDAEGGDTFEVVDPADGQLLARVADGSVTDAVEALDAAVALLVEREADAVVGVCPVQRHPCLDENDRWRWLDTRFRGAAGADRDPPGASSRVLA